MNGLDGLATMFFEDDRGHYSQYAQFAIEAWFAKRPVYFSDLYGKSSPIVYCWDHGITYKTYCVFPNGRRFV